MPQEETLGQILKERHWPNAALALVAEIDESTVTRIVKGESKPRAATAVRMAEGLGIGYGRMRRILAATWEAGRAAQADQEVSAGSATR
jgi:plasmid maintenance system antidote protein VapI